MKGTTTRKARWRRRRDARRRSAQLSALDRKRHAGTQDRFLAPAPTIIPPDATDAEREDLRFGSAGPPEDLDRFDPARC